MEQADKKVSAQKNLSLFQATYGSVTRLLERYIGEKIKVNKIAQGITTGISSHVPGDTENAPILV